MDYVLVTDDDDIITDKHELADYLQKLHHQHSGAVPPPSGGALVPAWWDVCMHTANMQCQPTNTTTNSHNTMTNATTHSSSQVVGHQASPMGLHILN